MEKALDFLKEYVQKTNPILEEIFQKELEQAKTESAIIYKCLKHLKKISLKGKRLRGALTALGYKLAGKKPDKRILLASLALEIFHTSVLVHDDVLDKDTLRRGEKTAHIVFGNFAKEKLFEADPYHYGISQAINIGDYGYFLSFKILLESRFKKYIVIKAQKLFVDTLIKVIKGQILDITHLSFEKLEEKEILKIFQYKTAEYTGVLPLELGMILGEEKDKGKLKTARQFGNYLGWAFQIKDDILGIFGDPKKTGKPLCSDIKEGKNTLFVYYIAKYGSQKDKEFLQKYLGKENLTEKEVLTLQEFFKKTGALDFVMKKLEDYKQKALKACSFLTQDSKLQELLKSFVILAVEREK